MSDPTVYPLTAMLEEELSPVKHNPAVKAILEAVGEYEHGTASVEDVCAADPVTMSQYASVALDIALIITNTLDVGMHEDDPDDGTGEPNVPQTPFVILNQRLWKGNQSVDRETFLGFGKHKLLVEQHHDGYVFQSYSRIKKWDGDQWQYLAHVPRMASWGRDLSYVEPVTKFVGPFDADQETLEELARVVLE